MSISAAKYNISIGIVRLALPSSLIKSSPVPAEITST
jgi:hypothetical protein